MKVRLNLLSKDTIRQLLDSSTFFKKDRDCLKILNSFLNCEHSSFLNTSSVNLKSRYCSQKSFNILVCGGILPDSWCPCNSVSCVDVNSLGDVKVCQPMLTFRDFLKAVCLKGDLYVFGGFKNNNDWIMSVDKYSFTSKTWSQVAEMWDNFVAFCACAFMDKIYIIGGDKGRVTINSCLQFDTSDYSGKKISRMNEVRACAACVVYEERIVVSGGLDNDFRISNTVESYDILPDKWSSMPNMNYRNYNHSLVVVKNKLFVISNRENTCEVFDNVCKVFITIKSPELNSEYTATRAYSIGKQIFVFQFELPILIYDTDKNEWSEESCEVTKDLRHFSCVKVPYLCYTAKI